MTTSGPPRIRSSSDFPYMCLIAHTVAVGDVVTVELTGEVQVELTYRLGAGLGSLAIRRR